MEEKAADYTTGETATSPVFTRRLEAADVRMSMDGRGRCMDNILIERQWRSLKHVAEVGKIMVIPPAMHACVANERQVASGIGDT